MSPGLYSEEERRIYHYFDGSGMVHVDPVDLHRRLKEVWVELVIDIRVARSRSRESENASLRQAEKIRGVFLIPPFEAGGLTEAELLNLLDHFLGFGEWIRLLFEPVCDVMDLFGGFREFFGGKPSYLEFFGLWMNRKRQSYRRAGVVALGTGIAMGNITPGMDYYRAVADGEGEMMLLKSQFEAAQQQRNRFD